MSSDFLSLTSPTICRIVSLATTGDSDDHGPHHHRHMDRPAMADRLADQPVSDQGETLTCLNIAGFKNKPGLRRKIRSSYFVKCFFITKLAFKSCFGNLMPN